MLLKDRLGVSDSDAAGRLVTSSIGTSLFPQNARTAGELVAFADSAMYRAKEAGRNNVKFYDGTMHAWFGTPWAGARFAPCLGA